MEHIIPEKNKFPGSLFRLRSQTPGDSCVLFFAINGVGLGHLTRCLAVAKLLQERQPDREIAFVCTSVAVSLVVQHGFKCFHIPPFSLMGGNVTAKNWNKFLFRSLEQVHRLLKPKTLVFDGTYVYQGLERYLRRHSFDKKVWIHRGNFKDSASVQGDKIKALFTNVLIPGEPFPESRDIQQSSMGQIPPITVCAPSELLARNIAREALGCPSHKHLVLLQLGAGILGNANQEESAIVQYLGSLDDVHLVIARSPISPAGLSGYGSVRMIREYPLSPYYSGVDTVISAAGYNSVTELVKFNVQSILLPNLETKSDDQLARAQRCAQFENLQYLERFELDAFRHIFESVRANNTAIDGAERFSDGRESVVALLQ